MLRKLLLPSLALCLFCATARPYRFTSYTQNATAMAAVRTGSVAVLPMTGPEGGRFADALCAQLQKAGRLRVVDRELVAGLYRDQGLVPSRVDQAMATRLGRMLSAQAVMTGSVSEYRPGRVGAGLRLVVVETGETAWQGEEMLEASNTRVQALAGDREDRGRLQRDADYLAMWLARLAAESIR